MKKVRFLVLLFFTTFVLLGCDFFNSKSTTSTTDTSITSSTSDISSTTTVDAYEGPYFLSVNATDFIPNDNQMLYSHNQTAKPIEIKEKFITNSTSSIIDYSDEKAIYYTTKQKKNYLVIEIEQPFNVEDQYVISSITIQYPSGSKIKWTNSTTEPGGNRKWYSNYSNTLFYIPFTSPNTIEQTGYDYKVTAIQYINGILNEDVRFAEECLDTIRVYVEKDHIHSGGEPVGEYFPDTNTIVLTSFYDFDNAIVHEIYVNDVLQMTGDFDLESGDIITISNPIVSFASHFVSITIIYDNGLGILKSFYGIALQLGLEQSPSYYFPIYNSVQFNKIPKDYIARIDLVASITLTEAFIPFSNYQINIDGHGRTLTVPTDLVLWEYYDHNDYMGEFDSFAINIRDLTISGKVKLINGTDEIYNLFTHAPISAFTLVNINYDGLNN